MDRLQLNKMIDANNVQDCTEDIRTKKHSDKIREDVHRLLELKKKYTRLSKSNPVQFDTMCVSQCQFLFNTYTDIFNKVKKDEINLDILSQLLSVLKKIEQGELDQHAGAYEVGMLMKAIYIDGALLKAKKLDDTTVPDLPPVKEVSWKQFKATL
jgi:hypothetical protein